MGNDSCAGWSPRFCPWLSCAGLKVYQHLQCLQKLSRQPCVGFGFTVTFQNCRTVLGLFYPFYLSVTTGPLGHSVLRLHYYYVNSHGLTSGPFLVRCSAYVVPYWICHLHGDVCNSWWWAVTACGNNGNCVKRFPEKDWNWILFLETNYVLPLAFWSTTTSTPYDRAV